MVILLEDSDNIQYSCNNCDYNTLCKKDFVKHLNTKKHEIKTNGYIKVTDYDSENDLLKEKSNFKNSEMFIIANLVFRKNGYYLLRVDSAM